MNIARQKRVDNLAQIIEAFLLGNLIDEGAFFG